jgi:hypothetical protein
VEISRDQKLKYGNMSETYILSIYFSEDFCLNVAGCARNQVRGWKKVLLGQLGRVNWVGPLVPTDPKQLKWAICLSKT